jgi:GNAT superfamily N-acetyltransferase
MRFEIAKLTATHPVADFDCGRPALNTFLARHALANQALANQTMGGAQTYIGLADDGAIVGYYSLAVGETAHAAAPARLAKGLARHPIPIMVLARLALARAWQGRGIGAGLLKDAFRRTLNAAEIAGIRAMVVHAKDDGARSFYAHFGFQGWPERPLQLFMLLKDARVR